MTEKPKRDWSQFKLRLLINKPVSRVFEAWTSDRIVSRWFTEKTVIEPRKNGRLYFEWLAGESMEAKVIAIARNRYFTFPFGSKGERVTVRFRKAGAGCVCEIHQYNMKTTPESKWGMHKGCLQGWTFFLANLKAYLEHGIDLRGHDPKRSYRQDYINS